PLEHPPNVLLQRGWVRHAGLRALFECKHDAFPGLFKDVPGGLLVDETTIHHVGTIHDLTRLHIHADDHHHHAVSRELAPITEPLAPHIPDPEAVHERHPRPHTIDLGDLLPDLHHVAVLADQDAFARQTDLLREPRMVLQVAPLAVDRDEPPRAHER